MKDFNKLINEKAIKYLDSKTESDFNDFYREVNERWKRDNVSFMLSRKYNINEHETIACMDDSLIEAIDNFNTFGTEYSFYNYLSSILSKKVIDTAKHNTREKRGGRESSNYDDVYAIEDDPNLVKFIPHANADNEEFDDYVKSSEQRQLLAQLLGKADDKCRQAVEAFRKTGNYYGAAKLLGIDDKTVKRRIEKVARHFNRQQFGDVSDYFTVPTEPNVSVRNNTKAKAS